MKTLDTFSKRILVIAVSISLVLFSVSAFLMTIHRVTAAPAPMQDTTVPKYLSFAQDNIVFLLKWDGGRYRLVHKTMRNVEADGIN